MNKKSKPAAFVVCAALTAIVLYSSAYACQVEDFFLTKAGNFAATTPEALNNVLASVQGDQARLADLLQNGTVLKLKEGIKVQVLERSFEWKMLKIKLPDGNATWWVKDGALKQIDCK